MTLNKAPVHNDQSRYGVYSAQLLQTLAQNGGYRLVGLYFGLLAWLDKEDVNDRSLSAALSFLGIDEPTYRELSTQLAAHGLLQVTLENGEEKIWLIEPTTTVKHRVVPIRNVVTQATEAAASAERSEQAPLDAGSSLQAFLDKFLRLDKDQQVAELSERFRQEFAGAQGELTQNECEQLIYWLGHWPPVMILLALQEAVMANARSFRYIDRVLLNWQKNKVRTIQDVFSLKKQWEEKAKGEGQHGPHRKYTVAKQRLGQRPQAVAWETDEELW